MKRWTYSIRIDGIVTETSDDNGQIMQESIDDIRGVVLESFRPDLQIGVKIESHSITVSELQSND